MLANYCKENRKWRKSILFEYYVDDAWHMPDLISWPLEPIAIN